MKKIFFILFIFLIFANPVFAQNWYNSSWHMRVPVNISYTSNMSNASVNVTLNFTQLLEQLGISGTFDPNSIRVIETTEEIPHDFYNTTIDRGNVSWVANGTTLLNTNRTFWIYFDIIENGAKNEGKIISENTSWESEYEHNANIWSNNTTSPGIGYEWNRSWAQSIEVSWRWCTEGGFDWAYLYVNGVQVRNNDGTSSEIALFSGNRISARFTSDSGGKPGECGSYGTRVDWLKFYQTTNYTIYPLTSIAGNPELQPLSITVETDKSSYSYNETVLISGIVRDAIDSPVNSSTVNLTVYYPNQTEAYSSILQTNSSGIYNDSLPIIGEDGGTYSVNVTANKPYYSNASNSTTFYYTANRAPVLGNESVSPYPTPAGWGENFTYSIDISDYENDEVNVTLLVYQGGTWIRNETKNITPPGTLNWTIAPFSTSDVGYNRTYMFEYRDGNISWRNTTPFDGPELEKDDIILEYLIGNNSSVSRYVNITLGIRLKDIDRNVYISGESVNFWVNYSDSWNNVGSNNSIGDGNTTFNFGPNCSFEVKKHNWKANYTGSYYQDNQSDLFSFNVTGQLKNYLQLPTNGSSYEQGDIITVRGNLTDECSNLIPNANVNFSIINDSSEYFCDVNDEGTGWYNCSWDSYAKPVGNYSIRMNSSISEYNSNSTTWLDRFELLMGAPRITINIFPEEIEQLNTTQINATVLDQSGTGIQWVKINVTRVNGTVDQENMTNLSSTLWTIYYNNTWGNTSSKGTYNVTVYAADNNSNIGNSTSSFKVYMKLNITSYTLSSSYYQGDTGSIYFKVVDINNTAIENVNTTFIIINPNNSKIFNNSYSTNADGLIEPLPQFTISSDATLGNYTVNSYNSYYDNFVNVTISKNSSYNFTVYEKSAAEMLMLDLACPSEEAVNNDLQVSATVKSGLTNIDPDSARASLYDSLGNLMINGSLVSMNKNDVGLYSSNYSTSASSNQGNWKWVVNVTNAGNTIIKECFTRLVGGPFDVKNINVIDNSIPDLSISVDIENTGNVGQDVWVEWNLTRLDTGESLGAGSFGGVTVYVGALSTLTHPVTLTGINYVGDVKITFVAYYSGTERAGAYETFTTTTAPVAPPTGAAAGEAISVAPPVTNLEITDYVKEILIERGWIQYLSVKVKNSGDEDLHNVEISIDGEKSYWFEVQTNKTDLSKNETATFMLKLYVPFDEEKGTYYFFLNAKSDETSTKKSFTTRVFTSRAEMILYQIQSLRDNINDLKESADEAEMGGKNVTSVKNLLSEAESLLDLAEDHVYNKMYDDATEKIREAENLIRKAEYELTIAPTIVTIPPLAIPFEWILIIILIIIIIGILLFFILTRKKEGVRKVPGLKIKKLILETKEVKELEEEIESLREAEALLEEEYKEGLISKESYEELKSKYDEKILDIQSKTRK